MVTDGRHLYILGGGTSVNAEPVDEVIVGFNILFQLLIRCLSVYMTKYQFVGLKFNLFDKFSVMI